MRLTGCVEICFNDVLSLVDEIINNYISSHLVQSRPRIERIGQSDKWPSWEQSQLREKMKVDVLVVHLSHK